MQVQIKVKFIGFPESVFNYLSKNMLIYVMERYLINVNCFILLVIFVPCSIRKTSHHFYK